MLKSNNMGILAGSVYNVYDRGNLVSFTLGVREYDYKKKESVMVFYPVVAIYDNLKNLLVKLDKGTNIVVAYSLFISNRADTKYPQVGIRAEDITLMSYRQSSGNSSKSVEKETDGTKDTSYDDDLGRDINIDDLDEDLREYFAK